MYTACVTLINTNSRPDESRVVVDWSQEKDINIHLLVEWLKRCPRKGDIHVYIPSRFNHSPTAHLRTNLQVLGCRVTACRSNLSK